MYCTSIHISYLSRSFTVSVFKIIKLLCYPNSISTKLLGIISGITLFNSQQSLKVYPFYYIVNTVSIVTVMPVTVSFSLMVGCRNGNCYTNIPCTEKVYAEIIPKLRQLEILDYLNSKLRWFAFLEKEACAHTVICIYTCSNAKGRVAFVFSSYR